MTSTVKVLDASTLSYGNSVTVTKVEKVIWVTFDKVGFHKYPDAPDEVAYLRDRHRHVFKFRVTVEVTHNDREIEFHMLKNWLMSLYDSKALEVDYKSCEMLAEDLLSKISSKYGVLAGTGNNAVREMSVEVSEDGECGAIVKVKRP